MTPTRSNDCPWDLLMVIAHASFSGNWRRVNRIAMSLVKPKVVFLLPPWNPHPIFTSKESLGLAGALQVDARDKDHFSGGWAACNVHRDGVLQQLHDEHAGAVHQTGFA